MFASKAGAYPSKTGLVNQNKVLESFRISFLKREKFLNGINNNCGVHQIIGNTREYQRGKYHCTVDLLFDWLGLVCFANKNIIFQWSYN